MKIGVLALQGAFAEHINIFNSIGVDCFEIRQLSDINNDFDGLVLPGGESTVMGKLLHELDLFDPLKEKIENGFPVFGTCAGLLLLANEIQNDDRKHFATMPITVKRNAYGRQLGSFNTEAEFGDVGVIPMVFIRAPYIESVGKGTKVLSEVKGKIVAAQYENQLVTAFHPELTKDTTVHNYFIEIVKNSIK